MSDARPRLTAVGDPPERAGRAAAPVAPPRRPLLLAFLAGALALTALGWGFASHQARVVSRELAVTQRALAAAEARLEAALAQRAQVRTHVEALAADAAAFSGRLAELEALVAADPAPAGDAQAAGNESTRSD